MYRKYDNKIECIRKSVLNTLLTKALVLPIQENVVARYACAFMLKRVQFAVKILLHPSCIPAVSIFCADLELGQK